MSYLVTELFGTIKTYELYWMVCNEIPSKLNFTDIYLPVDNAKKEAVYITIGGK